MPFSPTRRLKMEPLFRDPRYLSLPVPTRLFLVTLLHYVDGHGREIASSTMLRELLFEFDSDVTSETVDDLLLELEQHSWLLLYESGRRLYMQINPPVWKAFVTIDGRDGSRHPAPDVGPVAAQGAAWGDPGPTAAEGKGEGWGSGESGEPPAWMLDPEMPPPQGCRLHPNNTGLIPCGPCGGASKIHKRFVSGDISHAEAVAAWGGIGGEEP